MARKSLSKNISSNANIVLFVGNQRIPILLTRSIQNPDVMILSIENSNLIRNVIEKPENYTCFIEIQLSKNVLLSAAHLIIASVFTPYDAIFVAYGSSQEFRCLLPKYH